MKMLLRYASDPYNPFSDKKLKPHIVEIDSFEELDPYIREGRFGGVIINFISDSTRAMYDNLPEDVQLELQIYNSWIE